MDTTEQIRRLVEENSQLMLRLAQLQMHGVKVEREMDELKKQLDKSEPKKENEGGKT